MRSEAALRSTHTPRAASLQQPARTRSAVHAKPRRWGHVLSRALTRINHPKIAQLPPRLQVMPSPLALRIRADRPTKVRPLYPLNPKPAQILQHRLDKLRPAALRIQILVAKDQPPDMFCRPPSRRPEGAGMPEVQQPGRRRRKATAVKRTGIDGWRGGHG